MRRLVAALALAVLFPMLRAQGGPTAVTRLRGLHGAQPTADGIVGAGENYKARFGSDGVEFTPAFGRRAPANRPLHYRLRAVGRGEFQQPAPAVAPSLTQDGGSSVVTFARGMLQERYAIRADGVAQSFELAQLPAGDGDLRLSATVTTALAGPAAGAHRDGVVFTWPGIGTVQLSGVEAIDAAGRRCRGTMVWNGGELTYVIPAAFVAGAALPLVVDPLLSTGSPLYSTLDYGECDGDYESSTDTQLVTFEVPFSAVDTDVWAARLVARQLQPLLVLIETSASAATHPRVVGLADRGHFLVAYAMFDEIHVVSVAAGGTVFTAVPITSSVEVDEDPELGVDLGGMNVQVVWRSAQRLARARVLLTSPSQPVWIWRNFVPGSGVMAVAINRRSPGRWLVLTEIAGPPNRIYATLSQDVVFSGFTQISSSTADCRAPAVDGDGAVWLCAWDQPEAPGLFDRDVFGRCIHATASGGLSIETLRPVAAAPFEHERRVSLGFTGESWLVGWSRRDFGNVHHKDLLTVDGFTCLPCESPVSFGGNGRIQVSGVPGVAERNTITLADPGSGFANQQVAILGWRTDDGIVQDVGGGCGDGGRLHAPCARGGNPWFELQLTDATPLMLGLLALGFQAAPVACGGCTFPFDPVNALTGPAQLTSQYGRNSLRVPLPPGAAGIGLSFYTQWATLGTQCANVLQLSNALQVTTQ